MQLTKEKLSYLLFLYKQREMDYTVTRLAQEVGVSKSTFSRVLNTFYQEGLTTEKGKGILSCQGCRMAREYLKDINKLSDWLKYTANFDDEEAYQEALSLVLTLSSKARAKLVNNTSKERLFELIDNVKEISGDMLSANLDDGQYLFAFTGEDYLECRMIKDDYIIPISKLRFHYSKEERILQTSVKIKVKPTVGKIHMPESIAIMNVIIK